MSKVNLINNFSVLINTFVIMKYNPWLPNKPKIAKNPKIIPNNLFVLKPSFFIRTKLVIILYKERIIIQGNVNIAK